MKNINRIFSLILAITLLFSICMLTSCSGKVSDYQESVVYINTTIGFEASNYDLKFTSSFVGTGFALGEPGKPVQYIGTCAHCVSEPSGVYSVLVNLSEGTYGYYSLMDDGTSYPSYNEFEENGVLYLKLSIDPQEVNYEVYSTRLYQSRRKIK